MGEAPARLIFLFFKCFFCFFLCCFHVSKCFKKKLDRGVVGWGLIFSDFWIFLTWQDPSVSFLRFIQIPVLWVYGQYTYFQPFSVGIDFSRQNLTSIDVRFWRPKSIPALWGLTALLICLTSDLLLAMYDMQTLCTFAAAWKNRAFVATQLTPGIWTVRSTVNAQPG